MDRSLLDYGQSQTKLCNQHQNGTHATAATFDAASSSSVSLPPPSSESTPPSSSGHHNPGAGLAPAADAASTQMSNTTLIFSAATPPATPEASPEGVNVMPVIKRDLVVRFTDKKNSVQLEMADKRNTDDSSSNHLPNARGVTSSANTLPGAKYKDQYEAQHYSRHPHGPMSPCDSENSVCNRSRENLIGKYQTVS